MFRLLEIEKDFESNHYFVKNVDCNETLGRNVAYYEKIGFQKPWILYYAEYNGRIVGSCGFKGCPKDKKVEIAYMTFEKERKKGFGAAMCAALIKIAKQHDPQIIITAKTLRQESFSTKILLHNSFYKSSDSIDYDGKEVWNWIYRPIQG